MSAHVLDRPEDERADHGPGTALVLRPEPVEVRRNAALAALLGVAASALAIAYLARAIRTESPLDWALVVAMAALGVVWLRAVVDARVPLLVADAHGVRLRLGQTWRGIPWTQVGELHLRPRRGLLRDGRLTVAPYDEASVLADLDPAGRRQARWSTRLYGAPLAVPLGLTTRVVGVEESGGDLATALRALAGPLVPVVELVDGAAPEPVDEVPAADEADHDIAPEATAPVGALTGATAMSAEPVVEPMVETIAAEPIVAEPIVEAEVVDEEEDLNEDEDEDEDEDAATSRRLVRDPRPALAAAIGFVSTHVRVPHRSRRTDEPADDVDEGYATVREVDPEAQPDADTEAETTAERPVLVAPVDVTPAREVIVDDTIAASTSSATRPLTHSPAPAPVRELRTGRRSEVTSRLEPRVSRPPVRLAEVEDPWDDDDTEPRPDPVIGPQLALARTRLGLGVDQLADRTRIRPHVIEAIEVDDFVPCGGDFYARGHLRTLARVLGVEAAPLVATYDERYADAPIDPRRVFEAELAGNSLRSTGRGPNWTLLVGAVMALVLAWSVARLFLDQPGELHGQAPVFNAAATPKPATLIGEAVQVRLTATAATHVVVRNAAGRVVFTGDLAKGQHQGVRVLPPVKVTTTHGNAVDVTVDGQDQGTVGDSIRSAVHRYGVS